MNIKCIAIDDEPLCLVLLKQYISRFPELELDGLFDDAIAGAEFMKQRPPGLLFIDINMPGINGVDLVRSLEQKPMIIFTTSHKEFAIDGFELDAVDYLLKPITIERFTKAATKAIEYYQFKNAVEANKSNALFVRAEYQVVKIDHDDIEYIESVSDYLKIHRTTEKPLMTLMTIKAMLGKLPSHQFKRIHRSYIVPVKKIKSVTKKKLRLNSVELPVSDKYMDVIEEWVTK
jgi:two-component system, LytTR family, response regulator